MPSQKTLLRRQKAYFEAAVNTKQFIYHEYEMAKALLARGIRPIDDKKEAIAESLDAQLRPGLHPLLAEAGNGEPRLEPASH